MRLGLISLSHMMMTGDISQSEMGSLQLTLQIEEFLAAFVKFIDLSEITTKNASDRNGLDSGPTGVEQLSDTNQPEKVPEEGASEVSAPPSNRPPIPIPSASSASEQGLVCGQSLRRLVYLINVNIMLLPYSTRQAGNLLRRLTPFNDAVLPNLGPTCVNLLTISGETGLNKWACSSCAYEFPITKQMTSRTRLKRKEIGDVLGGDEMWKHADQTTRCVQCAHQWLEN
ncbi:hypothetical protein D9611_000912 [Ephemerocybe angulata]|uniref:DNA-directed RNA polymerase II subunit RPB9-like zinc ribbon domain-containing protein n=1 Tax=Ephemerocybe angulata TaxID=980116 RepID=A0A8H5F6R3_9AGAR|nr:hypothetical protein D9611_000912 [Tulosesus angulatus]